MTAVTAAFFFFFIFIFYVLFSATLGSAVPVKMYNTLKTPMPEGEWMATFQIKSRRWNNKMKDAENLDVNFQKQTTKSVSRAFL